MLHSRLLAASLKSLGSTFRTPGLARSNHLQRLPDIYVTPLERRFGLQASLGQSRWCVSTAAEAATHRTGRSWLKQLRHWNKIYKQLSKARLSALVVSTATVGYIAGKETTLSS